MVEQVKTEQQVEQLKEQPKCPDCGSKTILYRVRTDSYLCRRCGKAFPRNGGVKVEADMAEVERRTAGA